MTKRASMSPEDRKIGIAIENIRRMTDENDHNGAVLELAKLVGDPVAIKGMKAMKVLHEHHGHMPEKLISMRTQIRRGLEGQFRKKFHKYPYRWKQLAEAF